MKRSEFKWYELLKDFGGPLIAAAAVAVGLSQYAITAKRDFVQPLRSAQLARYQEASSAAARLATLPRDSKEWSDSRDDFLRLYYGPLAMVEDFEASTEDRLTVELAMIIFRSCLDDEQKCTKNGANLRDLSLALAHACRESLGESWGYELPQLKGEYQKMAKAYWEKANPRKKWLQRPVTPG